MYNAFFFISRLFDVIATSDLILFLFNFTSSLRYFTLNRTNMHFAR